ncbi:MAG: serine/threonine-protein kinase, partial [Kofleriaceae bacterium]
MSDHTTNRCPDAETIARLSGRGLSDADRASIVNHAAACPSCHAVVEAVMDFSAPDAPVALAKDDRIDRYVIEERLGSGGMGSVYAARDPDLGRRVAVKLLHAGADDERLRREAQALARLAHPNVVVVYDVGMHAGQVFVAMALVEGCNLRQWLETPRSVPETLRHLIAAGRGLAAAHAAGLVHRDLKPDNLFVPERGEALV